MVDSFRHAYDGLRVAFKDHLNFRIHLIVGSIVIITALLLRVTRIELLILMFTINLMFIVEMINTSVEEITNLITIKWAQQAKIAKDVAAGMALLTAASAVLVGIVIFVPYFLQLAS